MGRPRASGTALRFCVIGAGSMGSLYGGLLARAGFDVTLLDVWAEHVDAIRREGLRLDGITGDVVVRVRATVRAAEVPPADVALVLTDANATAEAAAAARTLLRPDGFAVTLQNGIGNVEALAEALGRTRVAGGLSYHSAAVRGPGQVSHTHAGPTWLGELDGAPDAPARSASRPPSGPPGFAPTIVDDIQGLIWAKFVHNCAINAICAVTGLRVGEISQPPGRRRAADAHHRGGARGRARAGHRPAGSRSHGQHQGLLPREVQQALDAPARRAGQADRDRRPQRRDRQRRADGWGCRRPTTRRSCGSPGPWSSACGAWFTKGRPTTSGSRPRPRPRPGQSRRAERRREAVARPARPKSAHRTRGRARRGGPDRPRVTAAVV